MTSEEDYFELEPDEFEPEPGEVRAGRKRKLIVALVPIAIALIGTTAVFLDGLSARSGKASAVASAQIDPITTGSIAPQPDQPDPIGQWLKGADRPAGR